MTVLHCHFGDDTLAALYNNACLDEADRLRLHKNPSLAERTDWQSSRVLKRRCGLPLLSLSHSHGFSVLSASSDNLRAGIDIEKIRPRDFPALAQWVCSVKEQTFLAQTGWQAADFYRLWCIKESLIKAANLDFPADMKRVGYRFSDGIISGIRLDHDQDWYGLSALLNPDFAIACAWKDHRHILIHPHFHGKIQAQDLQEIQRY